MSTARRKTPIELQRLGVAALDQALGLGSGVEIGEGRRGEIGRCLVGGGGQAVEEPVFLAMHRFA